MATVELCAGDFERTIVGNEIVVIDFWAPWCGPCRSFGPIYEAASERHPGIVFGKVNTQAEPDLAAACGIRSIPTVMVFRDKVLLFAQPGALGPRDLEAVLEQAKAVDMEDVRRQLAESDGEDDGDPDPDAGI